MDGMWSKDSADLLRNLDPATRKLARPRTREYVTAEHYQRIKKVLTDYRFPPYIAPEGIPAIRLIEKFSCKFFDDYVLKRQKEDAFELLRRFLEIPLHLSTRTHIWITSLFALPETEARKEVEATHKSIGSQNQIWAEVRRVLRQQLSETRDVVAMDYLREVTGLRRDLLPALPASVTLRLEHPMSGHTEKSEQPVSQAARLVLKKGEGDWGTILCPVRITLPASAAGETGTLIKDVDTRIFNWERGC
jgi:hypothetical protein